MPLFFLNHENIWTELVSIDLDICTGHWSGQYLHLPLYPALIKSVFTSASVPCTDQVSIYLCLCTLQWSGQHLPLPLHPALIRSAFTSASVPCTDQVSIYLCLCTVHWLIPLITNFCSKMSQYLEGGRSGGGGEWICLATLNGTGEEGIVFSCVKMTETLFASVDRITNYRMVGFGANNLRPIYTVGTWRDWKSRIIFILYVSVPHFGYFLVGK